jgi:uncharacterized protein YjiS (DUF1127 family)
LRQRPSPVDLRTGGGRHERAFRLAGHAARIRAVLGGVLVRLVEGVISWSERGRNRRVLASLNDRMLQDIGIDRVVVENDSTSWFWRLH